MYKVIKKFRDKYTNIVYEVNDIFPNEEYKKLNKKRIEMLLFEGYIEELVDENDSNVEEVEGTDSENVEEAKEE